MTNKKRIMISIFAVSLIISLMAFILPSIYVHQCKTRTFDDFKGKLTETILSSSIVIVKCEEERDSEGVTLISYSEGASGAVFRVDGETCYALTAYHVIKDYEKAEFFVLPHGAPTYREYRSRSKSFVPSEVYYNQFAKAKVLFAEEESDLAVISFDSEKSLNPLEICEVNPKKKERILTVSNPEGERAVCTYGTVRSEEYYLFDSKDGLQPVPTLKHNAYVAPGSSGGMALNQEMELVGIHIGGGMDIFHRFRYGVMVPSEVIREFLRKNRF